MPFKQIIQRLYLRSGTVAYQTVNETHEESWFVFPTKKLDARNIDYQKGFDSMGLWKFCRYITH